MVLAFKCLRVLTAIFLLVNSISNFGLDLYYQSQAILDGPLAWYFQYSFALNEITLAICLSIVLIFDFKISLPSWGGLCLKILGIIALILSLVGLGYLVKHSLFMGELKFQLFFYLTQIAYLLISLIIISKGYEETSDA